MKTSGFGNDVIIVSANLEPLGTRLNPFTQLSTLRNLGMPKPTYTWMLYPKAPNPRTILEIAIYFSANMLLKLHLIRWMARRKDPAHRRYPICSVNWTSKTKAIASLRGS
jgi:hypothetical protein